MAGARDFAINVVRNVKDKRSIKTRRKRAARDTGDLITILNQIPR